MSRQPKNKVVRTTVTLAPETWQQVHNLRFVGRYSSVSALIEDLINFGLARSDEILSERKHVSNGHDANGISLQEP